jgi:hypothetical protein
MPTPAYLDDFTTDNSGSWDTNIWAGGGFGLNHLNVTGGRLYVADGAGATHEFDTIAAAGHDFTIGTCDIVAVEVTGVDGVTDRVQGISVGLANLTSPYNELVASINGSLLGLCNGHSPDLTSVLIDTVHSTDGFAVDAHMPFWLALVLNGPDTLACIFDSDPMAGSSLPVPRAQLKWSDYAAAQGQVADPTTVLGTCVPQLGFWFTDVIDSAQTVYLDDWEAGEVSLLPTLEIRVSAAPKSIIADGVSRSLVTAKVTDASGAPLAGETVTFAGASTTMGAAGTFTATIDHGTGSYTSV